MTIALRALGSAALLGAAGCVAAIPALPDDQPQAPMCADRLAGKSTVIKDVVRTAKGRDVPVEVYLPARPGVYPLIGFSHGALAAPDRYHKLLRPLAAAGSIIISPMHLESEEFTHETPLSQAEIWNARIEDFDLALAPPDALTDRLEYLGYVIDRRHTLAMGHSYGALMAQLAGGARGFGPDGTPAEFRAPELSATIAWSPPGIMPGTIEADGWANLKGDALILTGTKDRLIHMQKDWRWHTEGYASIPADTLKMLWVGIGIDHYFGGNFGREKSPDAISLRLFDRALAQTLAFIDRATDRSVPCNAGPTIAGEKIEKDCKDCTANNFRSSKKKDKLTRKRSPRD